VKKHISTVNWSINREKKLTMMTKACTTGDSISTAFISRVITINNTSMIR